MMLNKEILIDDYINKNLTMVECAKLHNCSVDILRANLKHYNIIKSPELIKASKSRICSNRNNINNPIMLLVTKISRDELYNAFIIENQTQETVCRLFNLTKSEFTRLARYYNIKKDQKLARSASLSKRNEQLFIDVEKTVDIEKLKEFYIEQNHSESETLLEFNLTAAFLNKLRSKYNFSKPKSKQVQRTLEAKGIQSPETLINKICVEDFINDYSNKTSCYDLCNKYNIKLSELFKLVEYLELPVRKDPSNSYANLAFENLLRERPIDYTREFSITYNIKPNRFYRYDFKIHDYLIEINPSVTHSPAINVYSESNNIRITPSYHANKSQVAKNNGYRCIHIWDWDDLNKIISLVLPKTKVYARNCLLKTLTAKEANIFLDDNHLQGRCLGQKVCLGLYYKDELVQVMTFGNSRYSKKYDCELLRLCTKSGLQVIGGASKLFKYFIDTYIQYKHIVSYCDDSKFDGMIYHKLGFILDHKNKPSRHWYNIKTKQHITDNLLRQRGFDQLFGTSYGKGTSNIDLIYDAGFIDVYDCGQSCFVYNR